MSEIKTKKQRYTRRLNRTRRKVRELKEKPRLSVFRSNKHFYAQIIDDVKGVTLITVHEKEIAEESPKTKIEKAAALGKIIAKKALDSKVNDVVFDRGAYKYHGRVKAFADAVREGGLKF